MRDTISDVEDRLEIDEVVETIVMSVGIVILTLAAAEALLNGEMEIFYLYGIAAVFALGVCVAGWYYQRIASAALIMLVAALATWGIVASWEIGIWLLVGVIVIIPTLVAAAMLMFADHEEEVIEHAEHGSPTRAVRA